MVEIVVLTVIVIILMVALIGFGGSYVVKIGEPGMIVVVVFGSILLMLGLLVISDKLGTDYLMEDIENGRYTIEKSGERINGADTITLYNLEKIEPIKK
tara:strand:- start:892 stop:1188 length:297 start_codon:yes stop_codon:yes gene_type:complete